MQSNIIYTAIGDSLTVGVGAYLSTGFVKRYEKLIYQKLQAPVITRVFAKPRIHSSQLLQMFSNPELQRSIQQSNIITISIGGNDLLKANRKYKKSKDPKIFEEAENIFYHNVRQMLFEIQYLKEYDYSRPYIIQLIGLYNPFPKISYSDYWVNRFNHVLYSFTGNNIYFTDIHYLFKHYNKRVLPIGIHPNGNGYQIVANELAKTLEYYPHHTK
ncbi:lysophospholipase L1-like esterase [Evansella vedderi]|uniref:Lysophospholipase L1-like esterase n=1 Tax=Evansella vedderi TaxID=38282 RepID=A0ABU0A0M6_9BACI|nr:GDSL-type esterase/lipase family protein [Evansella vedderi]MDQ0257025.1 lysophospholipase L1-like esterase [Evansella vedderi]